MSSPYALHIDEHGAANSPTIVFSHGVGRSTTDWDGFVPSLSVRHRLLVWDQPGHGRSAQAAADDYGPDLAFGALAQVVGEQTSVVLAGHSLGGYLSARFALEHPEQVTALILIATGPGFRNPDAMQKWNDDIRRTAAKQNRPETLVGLHADSYVMDHLSELVVPTLLIVGSEDTAFVGATDYIEKKLSNVTRHTIKGAGHDAPTTHGDQLAGLISEFLVRL